MAALLDRFHEPLRGLPALGREAALLGREPPPGAPVCSSYRECRQPLIGKCHAILTVDSLDDDLRLDRPRIAAGEGPPGLRVEAPDMVGGGHDAVHRHAERAPDVLVATVCQVGTMMLDDGQRD